MESFSDDVLHQISNFLTTEEAVSISPLFKRWHRITTKSFQILDLDNGRKFMGRSSNSRFVQMVDKIIRQNDSPSLQRFSLKVKDFEWDKRTSIQSWIDFAHSRKVNSIDLDLDFCNVAGSTKKSPFVLKPSDSLEILKFSSNSLLRMAGALFPKLAILNLTVNDFPQYKRLLLTLFPKLPNLQELTIEARLAKHWYPDGVPKCIFNIKSKSLKKFSLLADYDPSWVDDVHVYINCPNLEIISLKEDGILTYHFDNTPNLSRAEVLIGSRLLIDDEDCDSIAPEIGERIIGLILGVSTGLSISLSAPILLALALANQDHLPSFYRMKKLDLLINYSAAWKVLIPILANSPSLEVLIIKVGVLIGDSDFVPPKHLPMCFSRSLKMIEVSGLRIIEDNKIIEFIARNLEVGKLNLKI